MESPKFKLGDKAVVNSVRGGLFYYRNPSTLSDGCIVPNGTVVEIVDGQTIYYDGNLMVWYTHPQCGKRKCMQKHLDPYVEKHKCTCPAENFFFNGRGCVCGGI